MNDEQQDDFVRDLVRSIRQMTLPNDFCDLLAALGGDPELKEVLRARDYDGLLRYARANKQKINGAISFDPVFDMTALEFAVYQQDWKMAAILFVNGADPDNNEFDGVVQTQASYHGYEDPHIVEGFDKADPKPIKGFAGLRLLVGNADEVDNAFLYIMELLHRGTVDLKADSTKLWRCVDSLASQIAYSSEALSSLTLTSLLALHRMGLSSETANAIVGSAVLATLWALLDSFATGGLSEADSRDG